MYHADIYYTWQVAPGKRGPGYILIVDCHIHPVPPSQPCGEREAELAVIGRRVRLHDMRHHSVIGRVFNGHIHRIGGLQLIGGGVLAHQLLA